MSEELRCLLPKCRGRVAPGQRLCSAELMPMAMVCFGKKRYRQDIASRVARERRGAQGSYRCPVCSRWHVGRVLVKGASGVPAAKDVVDRLRRAGLAWYVGQLADEWDGDSCHRDQSGRWKARMLG